MCFCYFNFFNFGTYFKLPNCVCVCMYFVFPDGGMVRGRRGCVGIDTSTPIMRAQAIDWVSVAALADERQRCVASNSIH